MIGSFLAALGAGGLLLLFFWVLGGSLGLPGGTITMISFGSLAGNISSLSLIIFLCFVAAVFGDIAAYEFSRKLSDRLRNTLRNFSFFRNSEDQAIGLLNKYGFVIVFLTRFLFLSLGPVVSYVGGLEKFNRKTYILAVLSGELLFAILFPLLGYTIGAIFNNLLDAINDLFLVVLLIILIFYLAKFLIHRRRRRLMLEY